MKESERKTESENGRQKTADFSDSRDSLVFCAACGAAARRESAKFCQICGKFLNEGFQPLDSLRASYGMQGRSFDFQKNGEVVPSAHEGTEVKNLFEQNKNQISQTAWACLVYSFVPYLGILFVPFTFFIGGFGYAAALRQPDIGGRRLALVSILLSFVVLAAQIFLWWLLYIIPELGTGM